MANFRITWRGFGCSLPVAFLFFFGERSGVDAKMKGILRWDNIVPKLFTGMINDLNLINYALHSFNYRKVNMTRIFFVLYLCSYVNDSKKVVTQVSSLGFYYASPKPPGQTVYD